MYIEAPQCVFTLEDERRAAWKENKTFGEMKLSRWKIQLGLSSFRYVLGKIHYAIKYYKKEVLSYRGITKERRKYCRYSNICIFLHIC